LPPRGPPLLPPGRPAKSAVRLPVLARLRMGLLGLWLKLWGMGMGLWLGLEMRVACLDRTGVRGAKAPHWESAARASKKSTVYISICV